MFIVGAVVPFFPKLRQERNVTFRPYGANGAYIRPKTFLPSRLRRGG